MCQTQVYNITHPTLQCNKHWQKNKTDIALYSSYLILAIELFMTLCVRLYYFEQCIFCGLLCVLFEPIFSYFLFICVYSFIYIFICLYMFFIYCCRPCIYLCMFTLAFIWLFMFLPICLHKLIQRSTYLCVIIYVYLNLYHL